MMRHPSAALRGKGTKRKSKSNSISKRKPVRRKQWARGLLASGRQSGDSDAVQIRIVKGKGGSVNATIKLAAKKGVQRVSSATCNPKKTPLKRVRAQKKAQSTKSKGVVKTRKVGEKAPKTTAAIKASSSSSSKSHSKVYVLQLEQGYVYVGKTARGVETRLREHMTKGSGSGFTRRHRPTGRLLPRLGNLEGDGDGPERDETLRQMYKRGPQMVRGWKYVRPGLLRRGDLDDVETNIRELFDLCRRCGKAGHFALQCREKRDRNGKGLAAR